MKILFISKGIALDYQADCLFHGLCSLDGVEVYILNETSYDFMFSGLVEDQQLKKMYGKGFTITNRIDPRKKKVHSYSQALESIKNHFYDFIVYGSITRCQTLLPEVLACYKRNSIIIVNGEDDDLFLWRFCNIPKRAFFIKNLLKLSEKSIFFMRELLPSYSNYFHPISFAAPKENIVSTIPDKKVDLAFLIPGRLDTYIYNDEASYNQAYQDSRFAVTCKKAGWDCLRHYEILANGCIPYFPDLNKLPPTTMTFFPKNFILQMNSLYEQKNFYKQYNFFAKSLLDYTKRYLTTEYMAAYVLATAESSR